MSLGGNVRTCGLWALCAGVSAASAFGQTSAPTVLATSEVGDHALHARAPGLPQDAASLDTTRPNTTQMDTTQRAQRYVDERIAVWRQRLKLEDWRISAVMTRRIDLAPQTLGGIRWDKSKKSAVIWVLDPVDYALPFPAMLDDMEETIVHELVHLELTSLPHSEAHRGGSEERAVSGIAGAMLDLDRRKQ